MTKQKLTLYYVEGGDTLHKIAKRFNTTEQDIMNANLPWISRITPGLKLWVPDNRIGTQTSEDFETAEAFSRAPEGAASGDITSLEISPRKVAYMGNTVPGYLTVNLKTAVPTKGDITVTGNSQTTKINLSTEEYKTEHIVNWVPFNDQTKQPLSPGQYTLSLNLYKQDGSSTLGIPAGEITVVYEANPKPAIDNITVSPIVVTNPPKANEPAVTVTFRVNRHVEVGYGLSNPWQQEFQSYPVRYEPGVYTVTWNGLSNSGEIMNSYEYRICFNGYELNFNSKYDQRINNLCSPKFLFSPKIVEIPETRFRELVSDIVLDKAYFTPSETNSESMPGRITLTQSANIGIYVANAAGEIMDYVLPTAMRAAGTYEFAWNGRALYGIVPNGKYYVGAYLREGNKNATYIFNEKSFEVRGSKEYKPVEPIQNVRVIVDYAFLRSENGGRYTRLKGEVFPIESYMPQMSSQSEYRVLLMEGVPAYVRVGDVEWIDLDKVPLKWGKTVSAGAAAQSSPDRDAVVYEYLPLGTNLRLLNKEGDWYRVVLASGKQGYVKAAALQEVSTPAPQEPTPPTTIIHTVAAGDTLWMIAQKYGVTNSDIVAANNLNPNTYLVIGQKLTIPAKTASATPLLYYVQTGDSLWKIAQKYEVTVNDIVVVNRLTVNYPLWVNQRLVIPKIYFVAAGDSLWKIAQKNNTAIQKLIQINGIDPNKPLFIGQRILIGL